MENKRIITKSKAEQKYKRELSEGVINTETTPHYNSLNQYINMLKDMGYIIN